MPTLHTITSASAQPAHPDTHLADWYSQREPDPATAQLIGLLVRAEVEREKPKYRLIVKPLAA